MHAGIECVALSPVSLLRGESLSNRAFIVPMLFSIFTRNMADGEREGGGKKEKKKRVGEESKREIG